MKCLNDLLRCTKAGELVLTAGKEGKSIRSNDPESSIRFSDGFSELYNRGAFPLKIPMFQSPNILRWYLNTLLILLEAG
jgi:hypothetical protein